MNIKHIISVFLFLTQMKCLAVGGNDIVFPKAEILNEFTTRIPFKLVDHLIVVEAELMDKTGNFIIDTGADKLLLNKVYFTRAYSHQKKTKEVSGVLQVIDNPIEKRLREFKLKNLLITNRKSDIIDLSHIEKSKKIRVLGIIGYDILKDYEVFIDLYLEQITLIKVDQKGNKLDTKNYLEKIVDSTSFKLKKHSIVLNAYVNDQKVKLVLDTASEFNQLNKNVHKKVLRNFIPQRRLKLIGASGKKITVLAGNLNRLKLKDSLFLGPMKTIITNLSKSKEVFGTQLDGVLGYEFLKYKRTIINYKKRKLYFIDTPIFKQ